MNTKMRLHVDCPETLGCFPGPKRAVGTNNTTFWSRIRPLNSRFGVFLAALLVLAEPCAGGSDVSFRYTGSLGTARSGHTETLLSNGKVLVVGGSNSAGYLASAELYNPASGTWTVTGSLGTARSQHTATLLPNGKVLVAGGVITSALLRARNSTIQQAAPGRRPAASAPRDLDTRRPCCPTARSSSPEEVATRARNCTIQRAGLGRRPEASPSPDDLDTRRRCCPTARCLSRGVLAGRSALLFSESAELYDPASGTWMATGSLTEPAAISTQRRCCPTARCSSQGGIIDSVADATAIAELYNPASGTWTATGSLGATAPIWTHGDVAAQRPGARRRREGTPITRFLASAELYDPASGTWTATSSLATARSGHTATLLSKRQRGRYRRL